MSRPRINLDPESISDYASKGMTLEKIGAIMGVTDDTLRNNYSAAIKKGWALRNSTVQEKQYEKALGGSDTMLIWLGKNWLGQTDKQELTGKDGAPFQLFTNVQLPNE